MQATTAVESPKSGSVNADSTIGIVVITHAAKRHLPCCLPVFLKSRLKPRVLVVNSSSGDGTVELARDMGAEVLVVPRCEFNHGATREMARRHLGTEIVVMVTPDAYAKDPLFLEKLVAPLIRGQAEVAYARQLPHDGADFFESFPRHFNYPADSHIRSLRDVATWGVYTFFCSNSCAAWRNSALDRIGGFLPVLTNEDYFAAARILKDGGRIAYVAGAEIQHSHRYTLWQEFARHFDVGYVQAENSWVQQIVGIAEGRGVAFARTMIVRLARQSPAGMVYALLQISAKWLGYRTGYLSFRAPRWWCRRLSRQEFYWTSTYASRM